MIFPNLRWTSCATVGMYDIEVAGKGILAGTGEGEVTGVGGDATTVVTEAITAGANDVTVTSVIGLTYDGDVGDLRTDGVTRRCRRCDIYRCICRTECRCVCQNTR